METIKGLCRLLSTYCQMLSNLRSTEESQQESNTCMTRINYTARCKIRVKVSRRTIKASFLSYSRLSAAQKSRTLVALVSVSASAKQL